MRRLTDRRRILLVIALSLGLSGCGDRRDSAAAQPSDEPRTEAASSLETLAVESGALDDLTARDPVGSYGRTYDGGRDRLCLIPDGGGRQYRFGAEVRIGDDENCKGSGTARRAGDRLIFSFSGSECMIVARYEGDRIVMPGAVDTACAAMCSDRGSLAGVSFPRTGSDAAAAMHVNSTKGDRLCG